MFSTIEELGLSAMSMGISPGELALDVGFSWKRHMVVLTGDGIFHFFRDGMEVDPPDSLADISEISKWICDKRTGKVVVPSGVTSIGRKAFYGCTSLMSVIIPDSATSIGDWAFFSCTNLTSVTIPDGVTSIMEYAFSYCSGLTSVTIQSGVASIGGRAFYCCTNLTSVTIPDSVTSIGNEAFYGCIRLKSIIIIPRRFENELEKIDLVDLSKTKVSFSG